MEKIQMVHTLDFSKEIIFSSSDKSISNKIAKAEKEGKIVFKTIFPEAVIARYEAVAYTTLCLRCIGDCFMPRALGVVSRLAFV
jgi:hypothetical protein